MPFPFMAAASLAAVVGATGDCELFDHADDDDDDVNERRQRPALPAPNGDEEQETVGDAATQRQTQQQSLSNNGRPNSSQTPAAEKLRSSSAVRFQQQTEPPLMERMNSPTTKSIQTNPLTSFRSMEKDHGGTTSHRSSSITSGTMSSNPNIVGGAVGNLHHQGASGSIYLTRTSPPSQTSRTRAAALAVTTAVATAATKFKFNNNNNTSSVSLLDRDETEEWEDDDDEHDHGFVDGSFSSGMTCDVRIPKGCHVCAYSNRSSTTTSSSSSSSSSAGLRSSSSFHKSSATATKLLAVGTKTSLDLYETNHYTLVHSIPTLSAGMVSAIQFMPLYNNQKGRCRSLLIFATLQGNVLVYVLDHELLEVEGVGCVLQHEFTVNDQVRALDCAYVGKLDPTLVVAVGDKAGNVTCASYSTTTMHPAPTLSKRDSSRRRNNNNKNGHRSNSATSLTSSTAHMDEQYYNDDDNDGFFVRHLDTRVAEQHKSGVLGLSIQASLGLIASSTKDGQVAVYKLKRDHTKVVVYCQHSSKVWEIQRNGPVRCVQFSTDTSAAHNMNAQTCTKSSHLHAKESSRACTTSTSAPVFLALGGYDKKVVLVNVRLDYTIYRELTLHGTVNTIAFDPLNRYLAVGCRDKTLTLFDTSTHLPIKTFHTNGWVTSVTWGGDSHNNGRPDDAAMCDVMAVRSENKCISILDLKPIHVTDVRFTSEQGPDSSLSWQQGRNGGGGRFLARAVGNTVAVTLMDGQEFEQVTSYTLQGTVFRALFCPTPENTLAVIDACGFCTILQLGRSSTSSLGTRSTSPSSDSSSLYHLKRIHSVYVETGLKALAWSPDGSLIALGGKQKRLYLFDAKTMEPQQVAPVDLGSRLWDIDFVPSRIATALATTTTTSTTAMDSTSPTGTPPNETKHPLLAVALGDYTSVILEASSLEPSLQILRSRTVRCIRYHPLLPILAIGDGAGTVAIVDLTSEEILHEFAVGGRVNALDFSPVGDYLVVGTDDCRFTMHTTSTYQVIQEIPSAGFALTASFSPDGSYLALGSANGSYFLVQLGPFLGIDLVPLTLRRGVAELPDWALSEALYRSGNSQSFLQRHMTKGGNDGLNRVATILREFPDSIFAFNRLTNETFFDTALILRKPNLLKLAITALVDGTLDHDGQKSILCTDIPERAREALADIVVNYSSDLAVEIFQVMTFLKVPHTQPRTVVKGQRLEKGSSHCTDPWTDAPQVSRRKGLARSTKMLSKPRMGSVKEEKTRTPAVLPLPGLGEMDFLASLLANSPPDVFDNDAMAVILSCQWIYHIRKLFYLDVLLFAGFFGCWVALMEMTVVSSAPAHATVSFNSAAGIVSIVTFALNSVFGIKEAIQARYGGRIDYFGSAWNAVDVVSIALVYAYIIHTWVRGVEHDILIPLGVVTTLILTVRLLSYLRGFSDTGWLISVLSANFCDVRGFLVILFAILSGFAVSFRLLFGDMTDQGFASLRRAFLSTFEMTIVGVYEPDLLSGSGFNILSVFTFILAITCVLVVALNALISILADSYARVQENSTANRRREKASLIVEYMALLPPSYRRRVEKETKWFHTLLEVDADGDLLVKKDDWEGGLNALRKDLEQKEEESRASYDKSLREMKAEIDSELLGFRKEVVTMLTDLASEVRELKHVQARGGITLSGKNVAKAVNAVKSIGRRKSLFNIDAAAAESKRSLADSGTDAAEFRGSAGR